MLTVKLETEVLIEKMIGQVRIYDQDFEDRMKKNTDIAMQELENEAEIDRLIIDGIKREVKSMYNSAIWEAFHNADYQQKQELRKTIHEQAKRYTEIVAEKVNKVINETN